MTERIMAPNQQNQDFYLQGLNDAREESKARIAALEKKLAALQWTPISPDNLPKVGDEVLHDNGRVYQLEVTDTDALNDASADLWLIRGCTHRRPINAPEREEEQPLAD